MALFGQDCNLEGQLFLIILFLPITTKMIILQINQYGISHLQEQKLFSEPMPERFFLKMIFGQSIQLSIRDYPIML